MQSDFSAVAGQREKTYPQTNQGWGATVISARERTVGGIRPALLVLPAGGGLGLLMSDVTSPTWCLPAVSPARRSVGGKPIPVGGLPEVEFRRSLHHYFEAMGMSLIRGHGFTAEDGPNLAPVAVVNQTRARRLLPGEDPIGQQVRTGPDASGPWLEIIGLVSIRSAGAAIGQNWNI